MANKSGFGRVVQGFFTGGVTGAVAALTTEAVQSSSGDPVVNDINTASERGVKISTPVKVQQRDLPNAAIVILNRDGSPSNKIIRFQTPPRTIQDAKTANFDSQAILGRSEPLRAYTGSNAREIAFVLNYYWYDYSGVGGWTSIQKNLNLLKSLVYPNYHRGSFQPAPKVLFSFGRVYRGIPCIVTNVSLEHKDPWVNPEGKTVLDGDVVPFHTAVSVALQVAYNYDDARGSEQIAQGRDPLDKRPSRRTRNISSSITNNAGGGSKVWTSGRGAGYV